MNLQFLLYYSTVSVAFLDPADQMEHPYVGPCFSHPVCDATSKLTHKSISAGLQKEPPPLQTCF